MNSFFGELAACELKSTLFIYKNQKASASSFRRETYKHTDKLHSCYIVMIHSNNQRIYKKCQ